MPVGPIMTFPQQRHPATRRRYRMAEVGVKLITQSSFKFSVWIKLTPRERLRKSWSMREQLPNPQATHDQKSSSIFINQ